jgi:hypothetical protein
MKNHPFSLQVVFVCLLILIFGKVSNAQEGESGDEKSTTSFSYGLKLGTNFHSFTDQQPHTGSKLGYTAGVFTMFPINETITLQLDIAYFQQGGKYVQFVDETRFGAPENYYTKYVKDASVTLHNVYVPLQARFALFNQAYLPDLLIGPYLDFNISALENYEKTGQIEDQYVTTRGYDIVTDQYKMFQFGAMTGLSFKVPTNKKYSFLIDITYKYGILPVKESYSYIDFYNVAEDINSNALAISLGMRF